MFLMVLISDSNNEVKVGDFHNNYLNNDSDCVTCNIQDFIWKIRKIARGKKITLLARCSPQSEIKHDYGIVDHVCIAFCQRTC
jgi:hypothetical protein